MDFTMNMMESSRSIAVSQSSAVAAMGGTVAAYQAHQAHQAAPAHQVAHSVSVPQNQQQQSQHQAALAAVAAAAAAAAVSSQQQQHATRPSIHEDTGGVTLTPEGKLQEMTKDDSEGAFTPPPRVASVGSVSHMDSRAEKGTDTTDFEPIIKIEIRGGIPGLNLGSEKDKNNTILLHFNSPSEVLHYFSQRAVPQLDAFNFLANPDLVRNINPELVRNHFLYVPSTQETVRVSSNGFSGTSSIAQTTVQGGSPIIVTGPNGGTKTVKQERRRGEVPPGTIIHRNVHLEALPNQFVCWICGLDLQKSLPFEEHMVDQHNVDKPYKCDDCGVTFKRKAHLDRHRRIHLPTRPYQCGVCGKGFTRNEHVRRHAFTHSGEKPYNCPTCGKTFSRREHLSKHLLSHTKAGPHSPTQAGHPQTPGEYDEYMYSPAESPNMQQPPPPQPLSLSQQQQQQQQQQQMLFPIHETSPSGGGVQGHPGLFHFSQFNSQSSPNSIGLNMSKQHRQNIQQGLTTTLLLQTTDQNGRIVTINQAGAAVPVSSSSLVASSGNISIPTTHSFHTNASGSSTGGGGGGHSRQHSGEPVARPYQCGVCGKAFIRNEHLRRHVLTHSGEKPHACSLCGKAFSRREHLTKHLRSHASKGTGPTQQPSPSAVAHSSLQAGQSTSASLATPQGSMTTPSVVSSGMQISSNNPPIAAHSQSVTHSMTPSHPTPVAHLPPGTHYLPMFSLLAEVV